DGTASQVVTVTINGTNDPATISGTAAGAVVEAGGVANAAAGTPVASGTLSVSDADAGQAVFQAVLPASLVGTYGDFTFDKTSGAWNYTLDATRSDVLAAAQVAHDTLTVKSADGTATQIIDVKITGANDVPVISHAAGSDIAGNVTEDAAATLSASGTLSIADADAGQSSFVAQAATAAAHGTFTLTTAGAWTYAADNTQAAIQQLGAGQTLTDSFTAVSLDSAASQVITVTIHGTNDPATISGKASGAVTEDGGVANAIAGTPVASGTLSVTDADAGQAVFQAVLPANLVGTYGDFTFNETSGAWNYTLDPTRSDVLAAAQVAHDTLTVQSADGSAAQVIDVTVTGANDAPVATGTYKHSVIDTVAPDVFADLTGVLTAIDPDAGDTLTWTGGGAGAFGALTVNANGSYSYAVDSVKVNALQLGFNATDSFTVTVTDTAGLADTRTIDVNVVGENDAPVIDVPATVNGLSISFTATDVDDLTLSMRVGGGKAAPL